MKINKQKTPLSCMWVLRFLGRDWMFGYFKIAEAAELGDEIGEDNVNLILKRNDNPPTQKG